MVKMIIEVLPYDSFKITSKASDALEAEYEEGMAWQRSCLAEIDRMVIGDLAACAFHEAKSKRERELNRLIGFE